MSSWPTNTGVSGPLGDGRCAKGGAGGDRDGRAPPRVERTASASVVASIARCVTRGVRSTDVSAGRHCSAGLPWRVWQRVRCRVYVGQWSQVSRHRVCCGNDDDTSTGSLEAVEMAPQECTVTQMANVQLPSEPMGDCCAWLCALRLSTTRGQRQRGCGGLQARV